MNDENTPADEEEVVSRSQRKREAQDIHRLGQRLTELTDDQLSVLPHPDILAAITAFRKIGKGGARKRQLQYIAKLLRKVDPAPFEALVARYDASSTEHVRQFHQLERWRERLIAGESDVFTEIADRHPAFDRQQLQQIVRAAKEEQKRIAAEPSHPPKHFRRLFQFLKSLEDS